MSGIVVAKVRNLTTREVRHYRNPPHNPTQPITTLDINLLALAHAAALEAMGSGGPFGPFHDMFLGMLTASNRLTWRGNGPGVGRELRRSYSNINGRTFARWYLQNFEGVLGLLPIEGPSTIIPGNIEVLRRQGEVGDMPDWIGWTSTGFVVAEAKGAYDVSDWNKKLRSGTLPSCLQKAQEQIARVQINHYPVAIDIAFKGWAIGSRWATENSGLDPWIAAIDPPLGEVTLGDDDFDQLAVKLQREYLRRALIVTGFKSGSLAPKESSTDFVIPFEDVITYQRDGGQALTGLLVAVGPSGFHPIRNVGSSRRIDFLANALGVRLVLVITERLLKAVSEGVLFRDSEVVASKELYLKQGIGIVALRMGEADGRIEIKQDG